MMIILLFSQFQDTNVVQYDIVKYMTGEHKGLTIVGGTIPTPLLQQNDSYPYLNRSGSEYLWLEKC